MERGGSPQSFLPFFRIPSRSSSAPTAALAAVALRPRFPCSATRRSDLSCSFPQFLTYQSDSSTSFDFSSHWLSAPAASLPAVALTPQPRSAVLRLCLLAPKRSPPLVTAPVAFASFSLALRRAPSDATTFLTLPAFTPASSLSPLSLLDARAHVRLLTAITSAPLSAFLVQRLHTRNVLLRILLSLLRTVCPSRNLSSRTFTFHMFHAHHTQPRPKTTSPSALQFALPTLGGREIVGRRFWQL